MLNDSNGTYIDVVLPVVSVTVSKIQVALAEPVQFIASLTLDQAMVLPWKLIEPVQVELAVTVQLLLANMAVATFWLICA